MTQAQNPLSVVQPWDLVAEGYAAEVDLVMRPVSREALRRAALKAPSSLGRPSRVLDLASGPGTLTFALAAGVGQVHAVDFSQRMLSELRRGLLGTDIANVEVVRADGTALPYPDDSFDAGFSMFGLMFFPDRFRGFAELHRTLRSGGIAVVASWAPLDTSPLMALMFGALRAGDPDMPPPARNLLTLENPDVFGREMTTAGFEDVSIEAYEYQVDLASADEFWGAMTRSAAPCHVMRQRLGDDEWARRAELSKAFLQDAFNNAPLRLGTTAHLGFGRKR